MSFSKTFKILSLILWIALLSVPSAKGYGTGAPTSATVCETMKPGHGDPITSQKPPKILVSKTDPIGGEKVTIILESNSTDPNTKFKGFLAMVKDARNGKVAYGHFVTSGRDAKGSSCFGKKDIAVTHTNKDDKDKVSFDWVAPMDAAVVGKELILMVTFVQDFDGMWIAVEFPTKIIVKKK